MLVQEVIDIIKQMYLQGGVEICTKNEGISGHPASIYAWTLIQPDGDVITRVSDSIVDKPEIWLGHFDKVEQRIAILRKFRMLLKWISSSSILVLLLTAYSVWTAIGEGYLKVGISAFLGILLSVSLFLIRRLAGSILRGLIKRRLVRGLTAP